VHDILDGLFQIWARLLIARPQVEDMNAVHG
jgi:hypothetical protein